MKNNYSKRLKPAAASNKMQCWKLTGGLFSRAQVNVVVEKELPIYVNGEHLITASIAPGLEREFVVGYLFGQGFVNGIEDIKSINTEGQRAEVTFKDSRKISPRMEGIDYRIVSGGGRTVYFGEGDFPEINMQLKVSRKDIFEAMNTIFERATIYKDTEGVHTAGLFTTGANPVCIVEDIGRHNTLDKVIGYTLMNGIDCSSTFLASTGRMASEMVLKICRAKIPIVATKTAITDKGLEIGRKCGLTIIGFVRDTGMRINTDMEERIIEQAGMKIYTGAQRILHE